MGERFDWLNRSRRADGGLVDVSNCEEKLRAITVKERGKKNIEH